STPASKTAAPEPPGSPPGEHDGKKQAATRPGGRHEYPKGYDPAGPHVDRCASNLWIPGV
ncbi:MAG: hypothetical protein ACK56F_29170, partial [bacterium]